MEYPKELKDKYELDKKSWDTIYELLMTSPDDEESKAKTRRLRGFRSNMISTGVEGEQDVKFEIFLVKLESRQIDFQIYFEEPKKISMTSSSNPDKL